MMGMRPVLYGLCCLTRAPTHTLRHATYDLPPLPQHRLPLPTLYVGVRTLEDDVTLHMPDVRDVP